MHTCIYVLLRHIKFSSYTVNDVVCLGKYLSHDCYVTTAKLSIHGRTFLSAKTMTNVAHPVMYSYTREYVNIVQLRPAGDCYSPGMKYKNSRMQHAKNVVTSQWLGVRY